MPRLKAFDDGGCLLTCEPSFTMSVGAAFRTFRAVMRERWEAFFVAPSDRAGVQSILRARLGVTGTGGSVAHHRDRPAAVRDPAIRVDNVSLTSIVTVVAVVVLAA